MKRLSSILVLSLLGLFLAIGVGANAQEKSSYWDEYSGKLTKALASQDEAQQISAMQQIIQYSDKLEASNRMVYSLMGIYRNHKEPAVRQLALIGLYKTRNAWAMDFLRRSLPFEKNAKLRSLAYRCYVDYTVSDRTEYWNKISRQLIRTLRTGTKEEKLQAMQLVIQYADNIKVRSAAGDILKVFRSDKDQAVRKLSLVALYKISEPLSMNYLCLNNRTEKDLSVKQLCSKCLHSYYENRGVKHFHRGGDVYLSENEPDEK